MCFSYSKRPSAYWEGWQTARKDHVCSECHLPIRRGDRYRKVWGVWWGDMLTHKMCGFCDWLAERIKARELTAGCRADESVPAFGDLHEVLDGGHDRLIGLVPLALID